MPPAAPSLAWSEIYYIAAAFVVMSKLPLLFPSRLPSFLPSGSALRSIFYLGKLEEDDERVDGDPGPRR